MAIRCAGEPTARPTVDVRFPPVADLGKSPLVGRLPLAKLTIPANQEPNVSASEEQLQEALSYCIDFARTMLARGKGFHPFGAAIGSTGDVKAVAGWTGDEHPSATEVYRLLADSFKTQASSGDILGAALAVDVNIPSDYAPQWPDGLRVHLETVGYSRLIYVPYQLRKVGMLGMRREVTFAEPFAVQIDQDLFEAPAG